jgi:hypothetical protein
MAHARDDNVDVLITLLPCKRRLVLLRMFQVRLHPRIANLPRLMGTGKHFYMAGPV